MIPMIKSVLAVLGVLSIGEDSSFALLVSGASSQDDCWENCGAFVSVDVILVNYLKRFVQISKMKSNLRLLTWNCDSRDQNLVWNDERIKQGATVYFVIVDFVW